MGLGGHRGGGHHSHSSSSSSSSSSSYSRPTTNNYYGSNVSYGGWGGGWGGGTYFNSRPTPWTSGYYYNPAPVEDGNGNGRPPSQATSTCCCGCIMVCAATVLMLIIVGNFSTPTHFTLDVAETRKWQFGNSAYTQKLHIVDYSKRVEKYFVSTEPKLESTPSSQPLIHEEHATLDGGDWLHFAYYLNRGSRVSATFKVTSGSSHFFLIKGETDFNHWEDDPDEYKNVPVLTKYSSNSQSSSAVYTVASDDVFYAVFDNDKDYASAAVEFSLRVERTQYVLTGLTPACSADQQICDLVVEQGDARKYLVFSSAEQEEGGSTDETFELDVYNEPRWSGIAFFWLFLPSAAVLICYILPASYTYVRTGSWRRPTGSSLVTAVDVVEGHSDIELLGQTGFLVVAEAEPAGGADAMPTATSVHCSDSGEKVFSSATAAASESIPLLVSPSPSAPPATGGSKV